MRDVLLSLRRRHRLRTYAFWLAVAPEPHEPNRAAPAKSQATTPDQEINAPPSGSDEDTRFEAEDNARRRTMR